MRPVRGMEGRLGMGSGGRGADGSADNVQILVSAVNRRGISGDEGEGKAAGLLLGRVYRRHGV